MTALQQPFDRERVPDAELSDLNMELVEEMMSAGERTGRYSGSPDPQAYLLRFGGIVKDGLTLHPTVAGVLAFTPEPERWLAASGIDIAIYRSNQTQPTNTQIRQVRGTVLALRELPCERIRLYRIKKTWKSSSLFMAKSLTKCDRRTAF